MSRFPIDACKALPTHAPPLTEVNVACDIQTPETRSADGPDGLEPSPHADINSVRTSREHPAVVCRPSESTCGHQLLQQRRRALTDGTWCGGSAAPRTTTASSGCAGHSHRHVERRPAGFVLEIQLRAVLDEKADQRVA